jgi:bacterioferritin-associated ferredoxin
MYICLCNAVTLNQVEECARMGADSIDRLAAELGVGTCCGRCRECACDVLKAVQARELQPALAAAG